MKLEITSEERDELLRVVENYLLDTRVEVRHTQNREYREQVQHEEDVLRNLLTKIQNQSGMETPSATA